MIADGWVETNGLPKPWPASNARATLPCSQAWMWLASIRSSKRKLLNGITARRRTSAISTIQTKTGTALSRLRIKVLKLFLLSYLHHKRLFEASGGFENHGEDAGLVARQLQGDMAVDGDIGLDQLLRGRVDVGGVGEGYVGA